MAQFRKLCEAYALDDRSAMNLTLTFASAAILGGLFGALANYAPPLPRQRPVGTSNETTPRPLHYSTQGEPGEHYDNVKNTGEVDQEHVTGHRNLPPTQNPYELYYTKEATRKRGGTREGRGHSAPQAQRGQSKVPAPQTNPTSSTGTRPSPTSRTSRGSMTTTRSSPTTLAQQGGPVHKNHEANEGDEISWMAVSNNNPPPRGTTRLGPPTTTTTSMPPPPPPTFQDEDTPLPPPLQPDMLLNMGYPQGTTWVLEEGVWQPIFPGEAQGAPTSQATSSQPYHSGWSIFAAEDPGHTGSASSQGAQHAAGNHPAGTGHQPNHQQPQLQQPRQLPREAVNRGTAPAAANQWNSGWSPAHHNHHQAQYSQPQYPQSTAQGRGTWGYAATAGPSNGPWRPRYAPVYDPYTDPWHEDEEDDPLPAQVQSYPQELGRPLIQGGGVGTQQQWGQAQAQYPHGQTQPWPSQWQGGHAQGGDHQTQQVQAPHSQQSAPTHTQVTVLTWQQQQQALVQGSATYQANRLSAIQAQQARAGGANQPPQQSQPHPDASNPPGGTGPHPNTQGPQAGQQAQQQQPRLIPEELEKIRAHKRMKAEEQAAAPSRRWGQTTADHQGQGGEPQQDPPQEAHGDDNQEVPEQVPELEETCEPQGGEDHQQGQCQGGASQRNYHEGQGDQRRGNKATKSEIREEFRKRGLHKPDSYTWNQVAHWVDMVPFDAEGDGGSQSPAQQQEGGQSGDKEATRHRERYEARERGDLRHEQPREQWTQPTQRNDAGTTGDKAAAEHRERYEARQRGDYSRETPTGSTAQRRDTTTTQQREGHGSHQADSAAGEEPEARPITTRGGVAWWRGEDLQKLHDRDGVFNHFTYSWGGYSPPLTWPPELPLSGTTHLHLRYLAHGMWVGEVVARGSELTPPYGRVPDRGFARVRQTSRRGEREGFIPQGTAFELIPVGLVHRNLEPEQWVLRIRNLPPAESRDPAGGPAQSQEVSPNLAPQNNFVGAGGPDRRRRRRVPCKCYDTGTSGTRHECAGPRP